MVRGPASSRRALVVAAVVMALACAEFLSELEDLAAPVLTALWFTPDTVDITTAGSAVVVSISGRDETGVSLAVARLAAPSGAPLECSADTPTAGTATDGTWSCSATIAQGSEIGTWSVDSLRLVDALGNEAALGLPDLVQAGYGTTFEVIDLVLEPNRPPVADPDGPYLGTEGTAVAFDGTASTDPDNDPLTFAWNFGDPNTPGGGTAAGAQPSHTYPDDSGPTPFAVTLVASDASLSDTAQTTAAIANAAPTVTLTGPAATTVGVPVTVDLSFSDPGVLDAPWAYRIEWGDGTPADVGNRADQSAFSVSHTYGAAGSFDVLARVTDKDGDAGADTRTILVVAADLAVSKTGAPDPVFVDSTLTYTVAVTNLGPSGATSVVVIDSLPAEVTFGSASPTQGTCSVAGREVSCSLGAIAVSTTVTTTIEVTPTAAGSVINRAFVSGAEADPDPANNAAADTTLVIVPNQRPVANAGGPYLGTEGTAVAFDGTASTDPDNDPLTFAWNFGDPNTPGGGTAAGAQPSHTYPDDSGPTPFAVTLVASDATLSDTALTTAAIANAAPTVTLIGPAAATVGVPVTVDLSFSDPGVLDAPWAYRIEWGDGTPADVGNRTDQSAFSVSHTYGAAGSFDVLARVTDKDEDDGAALLTIVVSPPPAADLAVAVQATPDPVAAGATLTNSVTVSNLGPDDVSDVDVQLVVEGDVQLVTTPAACTSTVNPSPPSAVFDCTVASLPATAQQVLDVEVAPQVAGDTIVSTATLVGWTGPADPDLSNNTSVDTTPVEAGGIALAGRLLFTSTRAGNTRIFVKDLGTGVVTQLTFGPFQEAHGDADWSPDGTRIAFWKAGIWIMNDDGTGETQITPVGVVPRWSPDGNEIAYQLGGPPNDFEIAVVNLTTLQTRQFTDNAVEDLAPSWSADGTRIAYVRDRTEIVAVDAADGANETVLYTGSSVFTPRWSPDGTQIAFTEGPLGSGPGQLKILTLATGNVVQITAEEGTAASFSPAWSPDGQLIAVARSPNFGVVPPDIWVIKADGSAMQEVEASAFNDESPSWGQ